MKKEDYINKQGCCPRCYCGGLNYGTVKFEDTICYFPYKCDYCGQEGEEWYRLDFQGHNIYDEKGEMIEL